MPFKEKRKKTRKEMKRNSKAILDNQEQNAIAQRLLFNNSVDLMEFSIIYIYKTSNYIQMRTVRVQTNKIS